MRLLVSSLLAVALFASAATAQIYKIEFKDPKKSKSFKQFCIEVNDELFLVGEAKSGIKLDEEKNSINYDGQKTNELWVADMDNPRACPYKVDKNGDKQKAGGKCSVTINGPDIKNISVFMKDQSIYGLSKEYSRRDDEISDLRKERDAAKKGTGEWKSKQTALVQTMERMKSWLAQTLYSRAAKKVAKEIESEVKASKEANAQRLELAKQSIKTVAVPEDLVARAKEAYGAGVVFHQQESQHARIIYREDLGDERIKGLLDLAENLIEGFRVQFCDPFIKEDFKDYIPDDMFVEWFFGPDDIGQYEKFAKSYYNMSFDGPHREESLKTAGHPTRRQKSPSYVNTWRIAERSDLEGIVAHAMGHHLVNLHYNQDRSNSVADWIYEGAGNWLALEYLGRNTVQCIAFDSSKYAKKGGDGKTGETQLLQGTADLYHRVAIEKGPSIDNLALKPLGQFQDEDVAKSYSLFNFIAKTQGEKGQRWLRACCNAGGVPQEFLKQWRKKSEEIFATVGVDIFKKINEDWQKFAEEQIGGPLQK